RRDLIDADLRAAETGHARLPAITSTDPQAETAARLIQWATLGAIKLTKGDIEMARIAGMSLMPQIAGLVLMLAGALWPSRRAAGGKGGWGGGGWGGRRAPPGGRGGRGGAGARPLRRPPAARPPHC